MPTTVSSANLNARLATDRSVDRTGGLFALACIAVLVLAAAAIFTLPVAVMMDVSDPTWPIGP